MKGLFTLFFLLTTLLSYAQEKPPQIRYITISDSLQIDSIKSRYSHNKKVPQQFEAPIYLALSYFPELDSTKIVFKEAKIKTTLNARPNAGSSLFKKKSKRKYVVRINTKLKQHIISPDSIPFNALVGLFGHEFSHLVDYNTRNTCKVFGRLFDYTTKKSKEKFEKEIDINTINRGLGWQLYDWSSFVLAQPYVKEKYKNYKKRFYLEPEEILEFIPGTKASTPDI